MSITSRSDDKIIREYGKELLNKISKEHFSFKKLVHIYEYIYICQGTFNS